LYKARSATSKAHAKPANYPIFGRDLDTLGVVMPAVSTETAQLQHRLTARTGRSVRNILEALPGVFTVEDLYVADLSFDHIESDHSLLHVGRNALMLWTPARRAEGKPRLSDSEVAAV